MQSGTKPTGGRGKKADYKTTHVRVPEPIKADVQKLIDRFHQGDEQSEKLLTGIDDAVILAKTILRQKKSAKVSLEKLLTSIYGENVEL